MRFKKTINSTECLESKRSSLLVLILTVGVFGIINTEMGVVGIIPLIAETFNVTVPQAGWTVSAFAFVVAIAGPVMPLLFSGINRKKVMLLALGIFVISNIISMVTSNFTIVLIARIIPAIFHPIYVSMAFSVAASSVPKEQAPKAVSRIFIGVSAGMVLGVPVTSLIASESSFSIAMFFFAIVNALVFIATIFLVPSIPVKERLSYGTQLSVLKKAITWDSIIAVTFINGAMFGFFSFMSDYLKNITELSFKMISIMLFIYGGANIIGNIIAGKLLVQAPVKTIKTIPFLMIAVYVTLFLLGELTVAMGLIIFVLGILAGIASNNCQYMITHAAPEAPDFANGLFLTSTNLGTAVGTAFCGMFITRYDTRYAVMGTLIFLVIGIAFVLVRQYHEKSMKPSLIRIEQN
jgi:predicted MFS family arabinose efflux permease